MKRNWARCLRTRRLRASGMYADEEVGATPAPADPEEDPSLGDIAGV